MHLTPRELDKLLVYMMAEVALKRKQQGLRLNHPEAVAVISAAALDGARAGKTVEEVMALASNVLSRADVKWFWGHYLSGEAEARNPYACPASARTLSGLPPALVITAEFDPLRDEGEAYAARLREEGVPSVLKRYEGVTHGFFGWPAQLDKAKTAIAEAGSALRAAIGG